MSDRTIAVVKIGGSVLTGRRTYRRVAKHIGDRLCARAGERLLVVVSAEQGATDALLDEARDIVSDPHPALLDLLWSTGETRSAAILALHLQALGVRATAANVHQTGLGITHDHEPGGTSVRPLRLLSLLDTHDVVVTPGFLARGEADRIVSLGRGGSDLTAVVLAAALGATTCELVKDVPGYFTADPKKDPEARQTSFLSYEDALELADHGCGLVQRQALATACDARVQLVVGALDVDGGRTVIAGTAHAVID